MQVPLLGMPPLSDSMTCLTGQSRYNNGSVSDIPASHTIMTHPTRPYYRCIIALALLFHHPASLAHSPGSTLCSAHVLPYRVDVPQSHSRLGWTGANRLLSIAQSPTPF